jgi:hypothetical protein
MKECQECQSKNLDWLDYQLTCFDCGSVMTDVMFFEEPFMNDYSPSFSTSKIANISVWNFTKLLMSLSGHQTRRISQKTINMVKNELEAQELDINQKNILQILKDKKLYSLYNHVAVICQNITGEVQPQIPIGLQNELINDFRRITIHYPKIKPNNRKYLPNYIFILRKLLFLKGYDDLAEQFTTDTYKTPKKVREVEDIFQKLVIDLDLK